jgi:hypothetical protein
LESKKWSGTIAGKGSQEIQGFQLQIVRKWFFAIAAMEAIRACQNWKKTEDGRSSYQKQ